MGKARLAPKRWPWQCTSAATAICQFRKQTECRRADGKVLEKKKKAHKQHNKASSTNRRSSPSKCHRHRPPAPWRRGWKEQNGPRANALLALPSPCQVSAPTAQPSQCHRGGRGCTGAELSPSRCPHPALLHGDAVPGAGRRHPGTKPG